MNFQERKAYLDGLVEKYPELKKAIIMDTCVRAYNLLSKDDKIMKNILSEKLDNLAEGLEKELEEYSKGK